MTYNPPTPKSRNPTLLRPTSTHDPTPNTATRPNRATGPTADHSDRGTNTTNIGRVAPTTR